MRGLAIPVLWAATLALAYLGGAHFGTDAGGAPPAQPAADRGAGTGAPAATPLARLQPAPGAREPRTEPAARTPTSLPPVAGLPEGPLPAFSLDGVTTAEEASQLLMAHLAALLAKGPGAHLELLRFLDEHVIENKELEALFGRNDEQMAAQIYPWIKFLVARDAQVVDVGETVFRTLAEKPEALEGLDKDTLELFTEGLGFLLPGVVSSERMDRFRAYATQFLERPEGELPQEVQRVRRDVERLLALWAPARSVEEIQALIDSGSVAPQEVLGALARLPPEARARLDLARHFAGPISYGEMRVIMLLGGVPLDAGTLATLDAAAEEGAAAGRLNEWTLYTYLRQTGRAGWPAAQPLVESALGRRGPAAEAAARALVRLQPRPPADYLLWVVEHHELEAQTAELLRARAR